MQAAAYSIEIGASGEPRPYSAEDDGVPRPRDGRSACDRIALNDGANLIIVDARGRDVNPCDAHGFRDWPAGRCGMVDVLHRGNVCQEPVVSKQPNGNKVIGNRTEREIDLNFLHRIEFHELAFRGRCDGKAEDSCFNVHVKRDNVVRLYVKQYVADAGGPGRPRIACRSGRPGGSGRAGRALAGYIVFHNDQRRFYRRYSRVKHGRRAGVVSAAVTGGAATSMIPIPATSVVLTGELPSRKSPCEEESAKTAPLADADDCVATHQFTAYLPASLNVMTPVAALYPILPEEYTVVSNITLPPLATDPAASRSI